MSASGCLYITNHNLKLFYSRNEETEKIDGK